MEGCNAGSGGEGVEFDSTLLDGSKAPIAGGRSHSHQLLVLGLRVLPGGAPGPEKIHQEFASKDVQFYGVNNPDTQPTAGAFERRFGISYPLMEGRSGGGILAMTDYVPPSAVLTTVVLDCKRRVYARIMGGAEPWLLRALIDTALEEDFV